MTQPLITLEELKQYLQINDNSRDALFSSLINAVSGAAEVLLGRFIIRRAVEGETHFLQIPCKELQLNFYPVNALSEVKQNGEIIDPAQITYDKQSGIIRRTYDRFSGAVLVTYEAGLAQDAAGVPADIKLAVSQWIQYLLNNNGGLKAETLGDYSVSYAELYKGIPSNAAGILELYKRYGV